MSSALHPSSFLRLARQGALAAALLAPAAWAAPFTVNIDATVTDQATGLVWDQCPQGQSGTGCSTGSATPLTWSAALDAARTANTNTYKGHTDWRLPNFKELESLVDITKATSPAIDTDAFPATPGSYFWSSTTDASLSADALGVGFNSGETGGGNKTGTNRVRLVRSGQSFASFDALNDTTAPTITAGPTATPGSNGTTASASVTVNEAATGFWQVRPAAGPPPTPATLLAVGAGQQVALAANVAGTLSISGLTKGTAYTLYFIARDSAGNAQASVASAGFTTPREPDAPTGVVATPGAVGSGQVTLTWTTPAGNGSTITGYTVAPAGTGAACAASPCVISGLANPAQHSFTVAATNGVGTGQPSAPVLVTLAYSSVFSGPSPTGSGTVTATVSGGGAACSFESAQLLPAASVAAPSSRVFPHGVLDFVLSGCNTSPVTVTISYPSTLPPGAQYWKRVGGTWGVFAGAAAGGSTATLTLVDGGAGDDDGAANGRIVDPGGISMLAGADGAVPVPTLGPWALALLAASLALLAWRGLLPLPGRAAPRR